MPRAGSKVAAFWQTVRKTACVISSAVARSSDRAASEKTSEAYRPWTGPSASRRPAASSLINSSSLRSQFADDVFATPVVAKFLTSGLALTGRPGEQPRADLSV